MHEVDWLLAGVLTLSLLVGFWRGLVYEVLLLFGWLLSFFLAQWFAPDLEAVLPWPSLPSSMRYGLAFALIFIAAIFIAGLMAALFKKWTAAVGLRPVDRTLGAVFGLLRGVLLLLALTFVIHMTQLQSSLWWQDSQGAALLSDVLNVLKPALPQRFIQYLNL